MSLPESLYMFAYCVFIVGAGWAIWQPQQTLAVAMVAANLVWFLCFQSFQIGMHVLPQT